MKGKLKRDQLALGNSRPVYLGPSGSLFVEQYEESPPRGDFTVAPYYRTNRHSPPREFQPKGQFHGRRTPKSQRIPMEVERMLVWCPLFAGNLVEEFLEVIDDMLERNNIAEEWWFFVLKSRLAGSAEDWYISMQRKYGTPTYEDLKVALRNAFSTNDQEQRNTDTLGNHNIPTNENTGKLQGPREHSETVPTQKRRSASDTKVKSRAKRAAPPEKPTTSNANEAGLENAPTIFDKKRSEIQLPPSKVQVPTPEQQDTILSDGPKQLNFKETEVDADIQPKIVERQQVPKVPEKLSEDNKIEQIITEVTGNSGLSQENLNNPQTILVGPEAEVLSLKKENGELKNKLIKALRNIRVIHKALHQIQKYQNSYDSVKRSEKIEIALSKNTAGEASAPQREEVINPVERAGFETSSHIEIPEIDVNFPHSSVIEETVNLHEKVQEPLPKRTTGIGKAPTDHSLQIGSETKQIWCEPTGGNKNLTTKEIPSNLNLVLSNIRTSLQERKKRYKKGSIPPVTRTKSKPDYKNWRKRKKRSILRKYGFNADFSELRFSTRKKNVHTDIHTVECKKRIRGRRPLNSWTKTAVNSEVKEKPREEGPVRWKFKRCRKQVSTHLQRNFKYRKKMRRNYLN